MRPVGDPAPPGAPSLNFTGIFFLWAPIHWEDRCTHFLVFEEPDGRQWHTDAMIVPVHDGATPPVVDPEVQILAGATRLRHVPTVVEFWPYGLRRAGGYERFLNEVASFETVIEIRNGISALDARSVATLGADLEAREAFTDLLLLPKP